MKSEFVMKKLIARILFIPITGFFVFLLFSGFTRSLNNIIYYLIEHNNLVYTKFDLLGKIFFWFAIGWITALFIFEIIAHFSANFRFKRLLTNLRYAPIAIFIFSILIVPVYDAGMIAYSKRQIRNYVFSDSKSVERPNFYPHIDYRGWCGNGFSARENLLYFETAAEGIDSENPYVRSRSLLMSAKVRDWINGGDERFDKFLADACRDSSQIVRGVAEKQLEDGESNCQKYLSGK